MISNFRETDDDLHWLGLIFELLFRYYNRPQRDVCVFLKEIKPWNHRANHEHEPRGSNQDTMSQSYNL